MAPVNMMVKFVQVTTFWIIKLSLGQYLQITAALKVEGYVIKSSSGGTKNTEQGEE